MVPAGALLFNVFSDARARNWLCVCPFVGSSSCVRRTNNQVSALSRKRPIRQFFCEDDNVAMIDRENQLS